MDLCSQLRGGIGNVNAPVVSYTMGLQCLADVLDGLRKAAADCGNSQLPTIFCLGQDRSQLGSLANIGNQGERRPPRRK